MGIRSVTTLYPGDVVNAGTLAGVGMGTSVRGEHLWLVPGDESTATIAGIGSLQTFREAAPPPTPGTGPYLPPIDSDSDDP